MDRFKLSVPLPSKEAKFYKKAMKCYDQKKYKNGIKFCKQIVSNEKCQRHPETLAVLSILLYLSGQRDDSIKSIKHALTIDIKNSLSWHVYSLINKYDLNYEECIKCLRQSLKFDSDNSQLLLELGSVLLHVQDFSGAVENRYTLLKIRSSQRQFWLSYIVSLVLDRRIKLSLNVMESFIGSLYKNLDLKNSAFLPLFSNILLFWLEILCSEKQYSEALKVLNIYSVYITDLVNQKKFEVIINIGLGEKENAVNACLELLKYNSENSYYYKLLISALGVSDNKTLCSLYKYLATVIPYSTFPCLRYLELTEKNEFSEYFSDYFIERVKKEQPNLFNSLNFLYSDPEKIATIEKLVLGMLKDHENAPYICWIHYFLAQHFVHLKKWDLALDFVDKVILSENRPIDVFLLKASILKFMGKRMASFTCLTTAHELEIGDRYIISLLAQEFLKQNDIKNADKLLSSTSKTKNVWDYMNTVHCTWYLQYVSKGYYNSFDFNRSFEVCEKFVSFFDTYEYDPMDFHMYCMRKATLSPYIDYQKASPFIRGNSIFLKVAKTAIKCYTFLNIISRNKSVTEQKILSLNDSQVALKFLKPLLNFDPNQQNCFVGFDFLFLFKNFLLSLKTLNKLILIDPLHPRTLYCHIRLIDLYQSLTPNEFISKISDYYSSIFHPKIEDLIKKIPRSHLLSGLYIYKTEIYLKKTDFNTQTFLSLFDESLSQCKSWIETNYLFKEFSYSLEAVSYPSLKSELIKKVIYVYPECGLDKLLVTNKI